MNGDVVECSSIFGEDEPNVTDIFQMGWFNHQLDHNSPKKYTNLANKDAAKSSDVSLFFRFCWSSAVQLDSQNSTETKVPRKELIHSMF